MTVVCRTLRERRPRPRGGFSECDNATPLEFLIIACGRENKYLHVSVLLVVDLGGLPAGRIKVLVNCLAVGSVGSTIHGPFVRPRVPEVQSLSLEGGALPIVLSYRNRPAGAYHDRRLVS